MGLLRLFGARLAPSASIHPSARIDYPWRLSMGHQSSIGEKAWIYCLDHITIGQHCCVGKDVYLITGSHDVSSPQFNLITRPITLADGVWVATGAKVLPGVTLEDMTVVAAGAVVVKSTEANDIVGGNPARFIKKRIIET